MIITTAVKMIDEKSVPKEVTLRAIAQRLGCAHTNLYNYFGNLEEIYWESLGCAMQKMLEFMGREDSGITDPEDKLFLSLSRMMEFLFDHPGWHRLIWLEPLSGDPPQHVAQIIMQTSVDFANEVKASSGTMLSDSKVNQICRIMYCYLYGEINTWFNQRHEISDREKVKESTLVNLRFLYRLALSDNGNKEKK